MFFEVIPSGKPFWSDPQKKFRVKSPCCDATKSTFALNVDVETVPHHDSVRTSFWAWKLPLQSDAITRKKFGTPISLSSTLKYLHCWGRPPSKMVWIVQNDTSFLLSSDVDLGATKKFRVFVRLITSLLEPRCKRIQRNNGKKIQKMQQIQADTSINGQNPSPGSINNPTCTISSCLCLWVSKFRLNNNLNQPFLPDKFQRNSIEI